MMALGMSVGFNVPAQAVAGGSSDEDVMAAQRRARSDYIEYCAGCHGVTGSSRPAKVPELRGRVGYFLCLPQGREYLIRLPNVASAAVEDDAALAGLMNYVVTELGGQSRTSGIEPYTAAEVGTWRQAPLTRTSLVRVRSELVGKMRRQCRGVPAAIERFN